MLFQTVSINFTGGNVKKEREDITKELLTFNGSLIVLLLDVISYVTKIVFPAVTKPEKKRTDQWLYLRTI